MTKDDTANTSKTNGRRDISNSRLGSARPWANEPRYRRVAIRTENSHFTTGNLSFLSVAPARFPAWKSLPFSRVRFSHT